MTGGTIELVLLFAVVFCLATAGTMAVRRLALKYGWVAMPRKDRWHQKPTALHGGVGFFPAFLLGNLYLLLTRFAGSGFQWSSTVPLPEDLRLLVALLIGALVMFAVGLADDIKQLRPAVKLLGQLVAASIFIFSGGVFPLTGIPVLDCILTYLWFVGINNAINMLDNMDGLSSGIVILATCTLIYLTWGRHLGIGSQTVLAVPLGLAFVASLLGFWIHNHPPASIFMGDSGSLFIGYVLAALAIPSSLNNFIGLSEHHWSFSPLFVMIVPIMALVVPILDITLVTITRILRAQSPSQGGRDHSSHRLVQMGLPEKRAVWTLYAFGLAGGVMAVMVHKRPFLSLPVLGFFALLLVLVGIYLAQVKIQIPHDGPPSSLWAPRLSKLLPKQQAAEILLDMALIIICFYAAYLLRFGGFLPAETWGVVSRSIPVVVASCLLAFFLGGIYRGQWRLISVAEIPSFALGAVGGTVLSLAIVTLTTRFESGHSRSAFIIFALLLFVAQMGSRLSFRLLDAVLLKNPLHEQPPDSIPVLIYGAGRGGKLLFDEAFQNPKMKRFIVIGFIDDDPYQVGRKLCGVSVHRGEEWVQKTEKLSPEIWVASKSIPDERVDELTAKWQAPLMVRRLHLRMEPDFEEPALQLRQSKSKAARYRPESPEWDHVTKGTA